jgi:inorganic pyrophosphatase
MTMGSTSRRKSPNAVKPLKDGKTVEVVIETPRGSRNKYKYDQESGLFKLSKILPEGMMFPYDFGFLPSTKGEDGDPLDVLVLTDEPTFPGCLLDCSLVGVLEAEQEEEGETKRNDRIIAVAQQSLLYQDVADLKDLNETVVRQIGAFFVNYQKVRDIKYKILSRRGPEHAMRIIKKSSAQKAA